MARDDHYLTCMNQCIGHVLHFTKGGRSSLSESLLVRDATFWNLHLVCYAAKQISDTKQLEHPEVKWQELGRLSRDLIGDPWDVDLDKLWEYVDSELPDLRTQVQQVLTGRRSK